MVTHLLWEFGSFFILQEKLIAYRLIFQVYLNVYIFSVLSADII